MGISLADSGLLVLQFMTAAYCSLQMRERTLDMLEQVMGHAVGHPADIGLDGRSAVNIARFYWAAMHGEANDPALHLSWLRGDSGLRSLVARYATAFGQESVSASSASH